MKNIKYYLLLLSLVISNGLNAAFFEGTYSVTADRSFGGTFRWQNGITLQYMDKRYPIKWVDIGFNMQGSFGQLSLSSIRFEKPVVTTAFSPELFFSFANRFDSEIVKINVSPFARNISISNIEDKHYKAIEDLILLSLPGSQIILPWQDRLKSYWKPILGGLGLVSAAGLGYAYYKYYHAK
jgi:hypothetical protein